MTILLVQHIVVQRRKRKKSWWLGLDMSIYSICSYLFNILKIWGGYISKMTQDAKLGHMLNVAVCTGQGEGEEIIAMTQNANYDHMLKVLQCRVTEL